MEELPNFNFLPDEEIKSGEKKKDKREDKESKLKPSRFLSFLTREEAKVESAEFPRNPFQVIEGGGERGDAIPRPELNLVPDLRNGSETPYTSGASEGHGPAEASFDRPHIVMPEAVKSDEAQKPNPNVAAEETAPDRSPDDRFSKWMREAGFDENFVEANSMLAEQAVSSQPLEGVHDPEAMQSNDGELEVPFAQATEQERQTASQEFINRYKARRNSLVSFAAGLLVGERFGKDRVRRDLEKTNTQLEVNRDDYNRRYWRMSTANRAENLDGQIAEIDEEVNPFDHKSDTHVERDAWHSIVVDKHNREDLQSRQMYGKEFTREQREVMQQVPSDQQYVGSTMGVPAPGADSQQSYQVPPKPFNPALPSGLTNPVLPNGQPTRADPQHLLKSYGKQSASLAVNPWIWLILGLLILVFFAASLL